MATTHPAPEPDSVGEAGPWALGNARGTDFATSKRCRHLGGPLAQGSVEDGCLVCPWHGAAYDTTSGRMVRGPQGIFARVPGLGTLFTALTRVLPLRIGTVTRRGDEVEIA